MKIQACVNTASKETHVFFTAFHNKNIQHFQTTNEAAMNLCVSPVLPGSSSLNCCHSAFCWATHRSVVCQHLETQNLTGASQSCTHTHSRGGPMGLETGSGQIYPSPCQNCDLSTPGSVATDVARQNEKGGKWGKKTTFTSLLA